jgi:ribonuclease HII
MDGRFPGYGFGQHMGYGTAAHLEALERLGPCEIHRRSFAPVRRVVAGARSQSGEPAKG